MGIFRKKSDTPQVIDLRDRKDEPSRPQWGSPVPCPSCRGRGYLDHIDPFKEIMYLHCTDCFAKYELSRAQMESTSTSR